MARTDLLMLSDDDLAALTNRGTVKRAQKEIEAGQPTFTVEEGPEDRLLFQWSDGVQCEFPAGKSIHDARCSSGSLGITRHIVRSVLAYQKSQASNKPNEPSSLPVPTGSDSPSTESSVQDPAAVYETSSEPLNASQSWDPGQITDEMLVKVFGTSAITRAKTRFQEGTLVELFRGKKPCAIFLDENCFVRFMVPGDVRYLTADCVEASLSRFAAMAVWAFRQLPPDKQHGLLSLQQKNLPVPSELLKELENCLLALTVQGVSQLPATFAARLLRLEDQLNQQALAWPAELVSELGHLLEMYTQHDARFDPLVVADIVGELVARGRAIACNTGAVPQLLIRGSRADRPIEIESGRYIGLGVGIRTSRQSCTLNVYLQAVDTGIAATLERSFANAPAADPQTITTSSRETTPKLFHELLETSIYRGVSLARLAQSQLLLKTGRRTAAGQLIMPRSSTAFSLNPQAFQWEQLKPPLLAESFAQVLDRLAIQPPSYLGPRRRTQGLHVVPLSHCDQVQFDNVSQKLTAQLTDLDQGTATLELAYHSRGSLGFDQFFQQLQAQSSNFKFIAGVVRVAQGKLRLTPISLIVQAKDSRSMLIPFVAQNANAESKNDSDIATELDNASGCVLSSPVKEFLTDLRSFVGECLLVGIGNRNPLIEQQTAELCEQANETGFVRIGKVIQELNAQFELGRNSLDHSWEESARLVHELALIARMAE